MAQQDPADAKLWTPELDVALFHSMHRHKPVGLNKNFHMVCIQHKLQHSTGLLLSTRQLWQHLKTLYDLDSLENLERFPFPNEEKEFSLPSSMLDESKVNTGEAEGTDELRNKKSRSHTSSSISPASSPVSKSGPKRKRT